MNEEQLITDLGAGEYTKEYFSTGRYQILCNSSLGHSVLVISGELQKEGKQYRASEFTSDGRGFTRVERLYGRNPVEYSSVYRLRKVTVKKGGK